MGERGLLTDTTVGEIYQNHYAAVLRCVHRRVGSPQTAQDLTGDVLCKAVRTFRSHRPLRWSALLRLYTIGANTLTDHHHRQRRTAPLGRVGEVVSPAAGPDEMVARRVLAGHIWTAADRLPGSQRRALWLRCGEDREVAEIADGKGRGVMAVKLLVHRAVAGVRARLELESRPPGRRRRAGPAATAASGRACGRAAAARIGGWVGPAGPTASRRVLAVGCPRADPPSCWGRSGRDDTHPQRR